MVDQGRYQEMAHEIRVIERPPMIDIPAYRKKRLIDEPVAEV
jgi:hypothetical protein